MKNSLLLLLMFVTSALRAQTDADKARALAQAKDVVMQKMVEQGGAVVDSVKGIVGGLQHKKLTLKTLMVPGHRYVVVKLAYKNGNITGNTRINFRPDEQKEKNNTAPGNSIEVSSISYHVVSRSTSGQDTIEWAPGGKETIGATLIFWMVPDFTVAPRPPQKEMHAVDFSSDPEERTAQEALLKGAQPRGISDLITLAQVSGYHVYSKDEVHPNANGVFEKKYYFTTGAEVGISGVFTPGGECSTAVLNPDGQNKHTTEFKLTSWGVAYSTINFKAPKGGYYTVQVRSPKSTIVTMLVFKK